MTIIICTHRRLTSSQRIRYKVAIHYAHNIRRRLRLTIVAIYSCVIYLYISRVYFHTQSVVEKAINYLSSFLKVERLTQNLTLQRWVQQLQCDVASPVFTRLAGKPTFNGCVWSDAFMAVLFMLQC